MFKLIIVGLDGSELAERALPYAVELGRGAEIVLVHVEPSLPTLIAPIGSEGAPTVMDVDDLLRTLSAEAERYVSTVAERLRAAGARVRYEHPAGDAKRVLTERAAELGADLIVLTTHGRSGIGRVLFGSVSEDVLRNAPCPVLVIPARDH